MIKIRKLKMSSAFCVIFAMGLIYSFNTIYCAQNLLNVCIVSLLMCFITIVFSLISRKEYRYNKDKLVFILLIVMLDYFYIVLRAKSLYGWLILGVVFPMFIIFVNMDSKNKYISKIFDFFVIIATFMAVISLVYWIGGSILNIIQPKEVVNITWGYSYRINKYSIFYYTPQFADLNFIGKHIGVRNCSIFAEAPMASAFFSIALLINEFYVHKVKKVINTVLAITIISTLSTTGWIMVILFLVYKVAKYDIHSNIGKFFRTIFFCCAIVCCIWLLYSLISNKLSTGSGIDRSYHIAMEWKGFISNPLIGSGFNKYTNGSSNSLFSLMADGGIILLFLYYMPIIGIIVIDFVRNKRMNYFMIFFMIIFLVTVIQYTFITVFLIAFSWNIFIDKMCKKYNR